MRNANVGSKKTFKTSKSRCTAGMQVRSGVKAGGLNEFGGMDRDPRQRMTNPLEERNKFGKLG